MRGVSLFSLRGGHSARYKLHAADAEHRQDGYRQHDDPHAAKPLKLLAVVSRAGVAIQDR